MPNRSGFRKFGEAKSTRRRSKISYDAQQLGQQKFAPDIADPRSAAYSQMAEGGCENCPRGIEHKRQNEAVGGAEGGDGSSSSKSMASVTAIVIVLIIIAIVLFFRGITEKEHFYTRYVQEQPTRPWKAYTGMPPF